MEAVWAALITGGLSLIGVILTCIVTSKKNEANLEKAQAVTNEKIQQLTDEVKEHNNFAKRMPVVENDIDGIKKRLDKLEDRLGVNYGR